MPTKTHKINAFLVGMMLSWLTYLAWLHYGSTISFYLRQLQPAPAVITKKITIPKQIEPEPVEQTNELVVPEVKPKPEPTVGKKFVEGDHLEWRIPEEKTRLHLKYKEKNGRLITEYEFNVRPGERIEIQAQ